MITDMIRTFREKLTKGFVLGLFSKTSDPAFIECMGWGGFDFVIIDLEHGPNSVQTAQNLIIAIPGNPVYGKPVAQVADVPSQRILHPPALPQAQQVVARIAKEPGDRGLTEFQKLL